MRIIIPLTLLTFSVFLASVSFAHGSDDADQRKQKIEALFSSVAQPDAPGAAVLVRGKGRILFEKGYGVRDLPTHSQNTPDTNFRLASFTKQFTAMAIMLLVHDGKLR